MNDDANTPPPPHSAVQSGEETEGYVPPAQTTTPPSHQNYGELPKPTPAPQNWYLWSHLTSLAGLVIPFGSVIAPLVLWLIKKDELPIVNQEAKETLNFNISFAIYGVIAFLSVFVFIGFVLIPAVMITWLVLSIMGIVNASKSIPHRYPLTFRLVN